MYPGPFVQPSFFVSDPSINFFTTTISNNYSEDTDLFALIHIASRDVDCIRLGENLKSLLFVSFEKYYENKNLDRLELTLLELKNELENYVRNRRDELTRVIDLNTTLFLVKGSKCYIAQIGDNKNYIYRGSNKLSLNSYIKNSSSKSQIKVASILFETGDKLVSTSPHFSNRILEMKYQKCLEDFDFERLNYTPLKRDLQAGGVISIGFDLDQRYIVKYNPNEQRVVERKNNYNATKEINIPKKVPVIEDIQVKERNIEVENFENHFNTYMPPKVESIIVDDTLDSKSSQPENQNAFYKLYGYDKPSEKNKFTQEQYIQKDITQDIERESLVVNDPNNTKSDTDTKNVDNHASNQFGEDNYTLDKDILEEKLVEDYTLPQEDFNLDTFVDNEVEIERETKSQENNKSSLYEFQEKLKSRKILPTKESTFVTIVTKAMSGLKSLPQTLISKLKDHSEIKFSNKVFDKDKIYKTEDRSRKSRLDKSNSSAEVTQNIFSKVKNIKLNYKLIPIFVLVALGLFLYISYQVRTAQETEQENLLVKNTQTLIDEAKTLKSQAEKVVTINKSQARTLVSSALLKLDTASKNNRLESDILSLKKQLQSFTDLSIDQILALNTSTDLVYSFESISGFSPVGMEVIGTDIYIADSIGKLYKGTISSNGKYTFVDILPNMNPKPSKITRIVKTLDNNLLIYDNSLGTFMYKVAENASVAVPALSNTTLTQTSSLFSYKLGNSESLYSLSNVEGTIKRSIKTGDSYGTLETRLQDNQLVTAKDMYIDGSIWVTVGNALIKYFDGKAIPYTIDTSKMSIPLTNFDSLEISQERMYISDQVNRRLVITSVKTGVDETKGSYLATILPYTNSVKGSFTNIIDYKVIDNTIYILDNNKVYRYIISIPQSFLSGTL